MKVLLIGSYLEPALIEKYNEISKTNSKVSIAAVKYSNLISRGFEENMGKDSEHLFLSPIGTYPNCKKFFWFEGEINDVKYIKFVNIIFLKQISIIFYVLFYCLKWILKNRREEKFIVFTFLYLPFLFSVAPLKLFPKTKFASFVPDMPSYEFSYSENDGFLKKMTIPFYIFLSKKIVGLLDYYVFITKYMREVFPKRTYSIMEGLVNHNNEVVTAGKYKGNKNAIMYSGALFEKFGINMLLEAFCLIEGPYELWLFGSGDAIPTIEKMAKIDSRIKFFGSLSNNEILKFQKDALLLINPRFSTEEFTKFSFPSKLMEYLSSGTPTITTRLPGIPADYQDKFYFIDEESTAGFRKTLEICLKKERGELSNFGIKGRNFVFEEKNYKRQIDIIISQLRNYIKIN